MSNIFSKIFSCLLLATIVFGLNACQLWGGDSGKKESINDLPLYATASGHMLEDFIPAEVAEVYEYNFINTTQRQLFKKQLGGYLININDLLESLNIPIETDDFTNKYFIDKALRVLLAVDYEKTQTIYLSIYNTGLVKGELDEQHFIIKNNGYYKFTDARLEKFYLYQRDDVFLITNNEGWIKKLATHQLEPSLSEDKFYMEAQQMIPQDYFGSYYANYQKMGGILQSYWSDLSAEKITDLWMFEGLNYIVSTAQAEDRGIRLHSFIIGNNDVLKKSSLDLKKLFLARNPLAQNIAGENLIFYTEGNNLDKTISLIVKLLNNASDNSIIKKILADKSIDNIFKDNLGIDLEKDILVFLKNNVALSVSYNDFLPAITLAIDVNSAPDKARKILDLIDSGISIWRMALGDFQTIIQKETTEIEGANIDKLFVVAENLPELIKSQTDMVQQLLALVFYYGITGDNILLLSTYQDLEVYFNKTTVSQNKEWLGMTKYLSNSENILLYFSVPELQKYLNNLVSFLETRTPMTPSDKTEYKKFQEYLSPFGCVIFGVVRADSYSVDLEGFIEIKK